MNYINEHLNNEKDGINITLFNKNELYLEFYLSSNKNKKFELELYNYYGPKTLKFKPITLLQNAHKIKEISEQLNNKPFSNLSDFFNTINKLFNF